MKTYLTYAPLIVICVWLYLAYQWYKSQKEFQKESGINSFSPFQAFNFFFNPAKNEIEKSAYNKLKQRSAKYFKIWIITILIFVIVAFIVGILTAKNN